MSKRNDHRPGKLQPFTLRSLAQIWAVLVAISDVQYQLMWNELLISAHLILHKDLHHQQCVLGALAKAASRANLLLFMRVPWWELVLGYVRPFTIATVILLMQWKDEDFAVQGFLPVTFVCVWWNLGNPSLILRSPSQRSRTAGNQGSGIITKDCSLGSGHNQFTPYLRIFSSFYLPGARK